MFCPFCACEKTKVVFTQKDFNVVRYRVCEKCARTFKSVEQPQIAEFDADEIKEIKEFLEDEFLSEINFRKGSKCKI